MANSPIIIKIIIYLKAHFSFAVLVVIVSCATWLILAKASPLKPKVEMVWRSSKVCNLLVVKRSQTISISSLRMPVPLSRIFKIIPRIDLLQIE